MANFLLYDIIGPWSEIKLDIIREYASAYSKIISSQTRPQFRHVYIDAFAGAGKHISKNTGDFVPGSPLNALRVRPPFTEYHFIDLNCAKVQSLVDEAGKKPNIHIHEGDCNVVLKNILPQVRYEDFRRALCILDPYGLHLNWEIIQQIGEMRSIEIFLNFPIADINRNVLREDKDKVEKLQEDRFTAFCGTDSWNEIAYTKQPTLFGDKAVKTSTNETIVEWFRQRLIKVAGFKYVPKPMAMTNRKNAVVYYLFFASHKPVAKKIVEEIFRKYNDKGRI